MPTPLPNYFFADLPPEAELTAAMITEACQTLRRNRDQFLATRSTQSLIHLISEVALAWRQPENPFRQRALAEGPAETGFSEATLRAGLDAFFAQLTPENLQGWLVQELGHAHRLDHFVTAASEERSRTSALAQGPALLVHVAAGNVPNPTLASIVVGLLVRSAQFVKCAGGAAFLPRLFAHSLYAADPKLGACLELADWPGGTRTLEDALFAEADCLTVTGSEETLAAIRGRLSGRTRLIGHGHRVSFSFVNTDALFAVNYARQAAARAAHDVAAWDQLGCLSPHVIYVETGGSVPPEQFAELLAGELERLEAEMPRGVLPVETAAMITARRDFFRVRAASVPGTRLWCSEGSTAWTVVFDSDPQFQPSCGYRFVAVKPVADLGEALRYAEVVRGHVSTVGLAADEECARRAALELARWGVTRVCPLGQMQRPPLAWRHDGRPALGDLVTWTDWEMP